MLLVAVFSKVLNWLGKLMPHLSESGSIAAIGTIVAKARCSTGWFFRKMSTP